MKQFSSVNLLSSHLAGVREVEQQLRSDQQYGAMLAKAKLSPVPHLSTCNLPEVSGVLLLKFIPVLPASKFRNSNCPMRATGCSTAAQQLQVAPFCWIAALGQGHKAHSSVGTKC